MSRFVAMLWLCVWAMIPTAVGAQSEPVARASTAPPRRVTINVYVIDVSRVNDAAQSVELDFAVWLTWHDPQLAGSGSRTLAPTEVWTPDLSVANELALSAKRRDVVEVDDAGEVRLRQRYIGKITDIMNFSDFPLDKQTVAIRLLSPLSPREVTYVAGPLTGREANFSIPDYWIGDVTMRENRLEIGQQSFTGVIVEMPAQRHFSFYLWSVIAPLVMVVFMAWILFWIDPAMVAPRVGLGATSVLTLVAYRFALQSQVPNLSYLTRMDRFMLGAFVLVFSALVIAVLTSNLRAAEDQALERRITWTARWMYPVLLVANLVIAFVV